MIVSDKAWARCRRDQSYDLLGAPRIPYHNNSWLKAPKKIQQIQSQSRKSKEIENLIFYFFGGIFHTNPALITKDSYKQLDIADIFCPISSVWYIPSDVYCVWNIPSDMHSVWYILFLIFCFWSSNLSSLLLNMFKKRVPTVSNKLFRFQYIPLDFLYFFIRIHCYYYHYCYQFQYILIHPIIYEANHEFHVFLKELHIFPKAFHIFLKITRLPVLSSFPLALLFFFKQKMSWVRARLKSKI